MANQCFKTNFINNYLTTAQDKFIVGTKAVSMVNRIFEVFIGEASSSYFNTTISVTIFGNTADQVSIQIKN